MGDLYVLHVLIITGIFIIAAMSLNLLLGYTGQLSLGHVAFFGIGAYTSSLVSLGFEAHLLPGMLVTLAPKPVWLGMLCGVVMAGLCGWVIGRISFKVRGAYFVIVTVSFAEVDPPGRAQLGGADAGADGAQQHPRRCASACPAGSRSRSCASPPTTTSCWWSACSATC